MFIGNREFLQNCNDIADKYLEVAQKDEESANILEKNGLFNQSGYFYIQAMEKYIKHHIAKKINITNEFYANKLSRTIGHSLDESLNLLLEIYNSGKDEIIFSQMQKQLFEDIFHGVKFISLHNKTRYPTYNLKHQNYTYLELSEKDCKELCNMLTALKKYLNELWKIK